MGEYRLPAGCTVESRPITHREVCSDRSISLRPIDVHGLSEFLYEAGRQFTRRVRQFLDFRFDVREHGFVPERVHSILQELQTDLVLRTVLYDELVLRE